MTAPLPASSKATNIETAPKTWFIYPLAVACTAAVLFAPTHSNAQTPKLRPDQERAIEAMLQEVEPAMRPMARQQLAASFANFNEAQIAMMMAKMKENKTAPAKAPKPVVEAETPSTPEDIAFMKAQYEPLMRKHHAAQVEFDKLVNAKVAAYCPASGVYARYGSGWRYEVGQFMMESALGANNIEARVTIAGEAYMPKDGRYKFDFSKVRSTFDKSAVDAAIKSACDKVHATGKAFLAKVDPLIAAKNWDSAFLAEGSANAALEPIRSELQAAYDRIGPGDIGVFQLAMMNGVKVK
jgi:gas vesicle protein